MKSSPFGRQAPKSTMRWKVKGFYRKEFYRGEFRTGKQSEHYVEQSFARLDDAENFVAGLTQKFTCQLRIIPMERVEWPREQAPAPRRSRARA